MQTITINFDDPDLFKLQIKQYYKELNFLIKRLPKKEQDIFYLCFILGKTQKETATILNLTQGGVSHRTTRAKQRLKYLIETPVLRKARLFKDLKLIVPKQEERLMLWNLYKTSCQTIAGESIGVSQSYVRHKLTKYLKKLEEKQTSKRYYKYYKAFSLLAEDNFNVLKEIKLPKWAHKNNNKELKTNKDMYLKLTAALIKGDSVLISEGSYRNLYAEVSEVYKDSKTADLIVQLNTLQVIAKKIPFNWFTKKNDMLLENVIHFLKVKKHTTQEKLLQSIPMSKTNLNRCISYLNNHNLVDIIKGTLYTGIRYKF